MPGWSCQHEKSQQWLAKQTDRLLPVHHFLLTFTVPQQVRRVVRAHQKEDYKQFFQAAMRDAGLYDEVPAEAREGKWVVDIKPVGDGQAVLKYLAPYVYRVAISDRRILACDDQSVTFRYTPSGSKTSKTRSVTGQEFLRGFLQHVLPSGYQKVRHYGWMTSNSRLKRDLVRWLLWLFLGCTYWLASGHAPQPAKRGPPQTPCPRCGAPMTLIKALIPELGVVVLRSMPATGGRPQKARGPRA